MKIALFGGTFNPVHYGHLRLAEEVREGLGFDKVIFVPAAIPPHKGDVETLDAKNRLEMTGLAIKGNPCFELSEAEIRRQGPSYTIDTIRGFSDEDAKVGKARSISIIIGADSFNDITTWCEYEEILKLASLVVVERPGTPVKKIAEVLPDSIARKYRYESETRSYIREAGASITYISTTLMAISSSEIRQRVMEGISIRYLLPPEVAEYIIENKLYACGKA
ncbi:MAG: nicotinate-nucleotide adenylyltransferase [Thermodesulfobacteriota bacterium]